MSDDFERGRREGVKRCIELAEARSKLDHERYQAETDWRLPFAFNRVVRSSLDLADEMRTLLIGQVLPFQASRQP